MSMGASTGNARRAGMFGGVSGVGVLSNQQGVGYNQTSLLRAFPGTQIQVGSAEFWIWAIFLSSVAYLLGVHWLLGSARHVVSG
jgi:hypothetical protein